ncbi:MULTISPECIES: AMP-binding protein [unclassified Acinetobacter]|uniref:AMP-binding protein n=1 Tax=unclassified Acinetobacter TaxID=196816 RepID=UPI0012246272|nr:MULTISPECIES: AMP-binding protein [unclassified Acinetobacter]RZJ22347.1 MAG: acyl-CoA synthetase [Acinetobacter sp.]
MLCHFQNHLHSLKPLCIQPDLSQIRFQDFWQDVIQQSHAIESLAQDSWALWEADSYQFLVLLFAALLAQKQVLLPPHRVSDLEKELAEQNIYFLQRQPVASIQNQKIELNLDDAFLNQAQLFFYTSGSTGQPKKIPRSLHQLLNEVQGLDASFQLPEQAIAIATVSHQHIYGLLFKLLWPLASGRFFYQAQLAFPEDVADIQKKLTALKLQNYVISSPALLKRWTRDVLLQDCLTVYSSGGKLESGIRPYLNRPITEVFGSSETGGIAHRQQDDALWTPFANVDIQAAEQQELQVRTNHAFSEDWIFTGDKVEVIEPGNLKSSFRLLGRLDRIVKLEEKRLSLDAIEQKIIELDDIAQCHVLILEREHRQILACVAVLSDQARVQLKQSSKAQFVAAIKAQLKSRLESIAIPRQWRFLTQLPQNAQSKLNKQYMKSLFQPMLLPIVLEQQNEPDQALYRLEFSPELECFKGHFPSQPIFPGVGQIGFIQHFARQNWAQLEWCNGFEQLKFQDLIQPYMVLQLKMSRKLHKVSFELTHAEQTLASGRLLFHTPNDPI